MPQAIMHRVHPLRMCLKYPTRLVEALTYLWMRCDSDQVFGPLWSEQFPSPRTETHDYSRTCMAMWLWPISPWVFQLPYLLVILGNRWQLLSWCPFANGHQSRIWRYDDLRAKRVFIGSHMQGPMEKAITRRRVCTARIHRAAIHGRDPPEASRPN